MKREAQALGVEISIPKGKPFFSTEVGRGVRRLEQVFLEPGLESLHSFYSSAFFEPAFQEVSGFDEYIGSLFESFKPEQLDLIKSLLGILSDSLIDRQEVFSIKHQDYSVLLSTLESASLYLSLIHI